MGPLTGLRVLEIAAVGPVPFAAMMLADAGATVVRVDRREGSSASDPALDVLNRGRRSIAIDLKHPRAASIVLRLVERSDVLLEGFRPGVMERLGLGPEACHARNRRLVYGRMTGWGQDGPLAMSAGHDINYIAVAGALSSFARRGESPVPPMNVVGDFGGGAMLLAFGVLCGVIDAQRTGTGQVVDAAMVDGAASFMAMVCALRAQGMWSDVPGTNLLDTGAPFYDVYRTADGAHVAIGAIEPQFFAALLRRCGVEQDEWPRQDDQSRWPELRARLTELFASRSRDEWAVLFEGGDACAAPVLSLDEAAAHHHNVARNTYIRVDGVLQPAPCPRFAKAPAPNPAAPPLPGADTDQVLRECGYDAATIAELRASRVVFCA